MDTLSNELMIYIFSYLSHKNINQCSLVCKRWNVVTHNPLSYKTIRLYNKKQLDGFIKMATTEKINNRYIGHYVRNILLQDYTSGLIGEMEIQDLKRLYEATPNATFIDNVYLPDSTNIDPNNDSFWTSLLSLPQWVQDYHPRWYQLLYNNKNKCTSLEFTIDRDNIINKDCFGNMISNSDEEVDNDNDNNEKKLIIFQKDAKPQKRRLSDFPVPKPFLLSFVFNEDSDLFEVIDDEKFLVYYAKVMSFTPKITKSFQHLKYLSIDFKEYCQFLIHQPQPALELDERIIESIHHSCPVLESLTIKSLFLNVSSEHLTYNSSSSDPSNMLTSCPLLKKLTFIHCNIPNATIFNYISKKYPSLTSFSMELFWLSRPDLLAEYGHSFKSALHDMIENYTHLSSLSINLSYGDLLNKYGLEKSLWDHHRFLDWIQRNSIPLKSFSISADIYTNNNNGIIMDDLNEDKINSNIVIGKEEGKDKKSVYQYQQNGIKSRYAYLDHLTNLDLYCYDSLPLNYNHFSQLVDKNIISFASLTSLSFTKKCNGFRTITNAKFSSPKSSEFLFSIYSWLNLLPKLKQLKLINVLVTDGFQDDKEGDHDGNGYHHFVMEKDQVNNNIIYSLKELFIKDSHILLNDDNGDDNNGLSRLLQKCPSLNILKLVNTSIELNTDDDANTAMDNQNITIDASHLVLDELLLEKLYGKFGSNVASVNKLVLSEFSSNRVSVMEGYILNTYRDNNLNTTQNTFQFNISCKYVDLVRFI